MVILKKILEQESKGWYIKYKDRLITELKGIHLRHRLLQKSEYWDFVFGKERKRVMFLYSFD